MQITAVHVRIIAIILPALKRSFPYFLSIRYAAVPTAHIPQITRSNHWKRSAPYSLSGMSLYTLHASKMYWGTTVSAERLMMTYAVSSASIRPIIVQCKASQFSWFNRVTNAGRPIIIRIIMMVSPVSTRDFFSLSSILQNAVPTMPKISIIRVVSAKPIPALLNASLSFAM